MEWRQLLQSSHQSLTFNIAAFPVFQSIPSFTRLEEKLCFKRQLFATPERTYDPKCPKNVVVKSQSLFQLALINRAPTKVAGIMMIYFTVNSLPGRKISLHNQQPAGLPSQK